MDPGHGTPGLPTPSLWPWGTPGPPQSHEAPWSLHATPPYRSMCHPASPPNISLDMGHSWLPHITPMGMGHPRTFRDHPTAPWGAPRHLRFSLRPGALQDPQDQPTAVGYPWLPHIITIVTGHPGQPTPQPYGAPWSPHTISMAIGHPRTTPQPWVTPLVAPDLLYKHGAPKDHPTGMGHP